MENIIENSKTLRGKCSKRYALILEEWGKWFRDVRKSFKRDITEYDTLEEAKEYAEFLDLALENIKRPDEFKTIGKFRSGSKSARKYYNITDTYYKWINGERVEVNETEVYENDRYWWGYVIVDFEEEKFIQFGGIGLRNYSIQDMKSRKPILMDLIFRKPGEIPEGYKWDEGEYEGWLQFRWGDGKNAIGYVEPKKQKEKEEDEPFYYPGRDEIENYLVGDELQDKFDDMEDKERSKRLMDRYGW